MAGAKQQPVLKVLAFNCSLKSARNKEKSSTDALLQQLMDELDKYGAKGAVVRAVDHNIKPGVTSSARGGEGSGISRLVRLGIEKTDVKGRRVVLPPIVERLKHGLQHFAAFGQAISGYSATAFLLDESGLTEITQPLREYLVA